MRRLTLYTILFGTMGVMYYGMEILFRGYSHWTMYVLGGVCGILVGLLNEYVLEWTTGFLWQCLLGLCVVLPLEFATGLIVNVWLDLSVWDYSDLSLNFLGQVSLVFAPIFLVPIAIAIVVDDWFKYLFDIGERPKYKFL